MATKCQTSVQVQVHLYCLISFACRGASAIGGEREIWTTEEKGSIWLVSPLYYSYQSPQSHKTHSWLVAHLQNREIHSTYSGSSIWAVSAEWLGRERPQFVSLISGWQMGNRQKWKSTTVSDEANGEGEGARVRCNLRSRKMSPTRLFGAYGSQISYGKPSILYTLPNLWIVSLRCLFLRRLKPPILILSVALSFITLRPLPHSPRLFSSFCAFFSFAVASARLLRPRTDCFVVLSEGCKPHGRADGAALFKYLMGLIGSADLVELRGELEVSLPKAATSATQSRPLRDRGD